MHFDIRLAKRDDVDLVVDLIQYSARQLQNGFYSASQIESGLEMINDPDQLIRNNTMFVAVSLEGIIGCGGWDFSEQSKKTAELKDFFTHPLYTRKGVARRIMSTIVKACNEKKVETLVLTSTLAGELFYWSCGFYETARIEHLLRSGERFQLVAIQKEI